jgi:hypothetical protein
MTPAAKEMTLYKSAWCMINLNEQRKAEELFIRLAASRSKLALAADAMRDLAFLVAHQPDLNASLERVEARFTEVPQKIDFLNYVREGLETQNSVAMHSHLVDKLLQLEKNPAKRLSYLLADLKVHRRQYAARDHMKSFERVREAIIAGNLTASSVELKKYSEPLEIETQTLIKSFIDTFAGRTKTPDGFSRDEMNLALKTQFSFFVTYLPESRIRPKMVNLWLDVCLDSSDWKCVDTVSELIITERKTLEPFRERAYINQLAALDKLSPSLKGEEKEQFDKRKFSRVQEFVEQFEKSPQWPRVAKYYSELNMDAGKYKEMLPLLDKIYMREPNEDTFGRLQFARYKLEDYEGVLADPRWDPKWENSKAPQAQKLIELKRETVLALALKARKKDDVVSYKKFIFQFLQLRPDPKKAQIARVDLLKFLVEKKLMDEATDEFVGTDPKDQATPEYADMKSVLWFSSMERGKFAEARKILTSSPAKDNEVVFRKILTEIALGETPKVAELQNISPQNRDYLLGLLAVTRPDTLLKYYQTFPSDKPESRELALLALRIKSGEWIIPKTREAEKILGPSYRFTGPDTAVAVPIEDKIRKVSFPAKGTPAKALGKAIEKLVVETRNIREGVGKAIKDKNAYQQLRVLEAARDLERRVGMTILESPVPDGLIEDQVNQYKEGLREASKEFTDQATEFDRLAGVARDAINKVNRAIQARLLPRPNMKDWDWSKVYESDPALKRVADAVGAKNSLAALVLLDLLRPEHIKGEADYFRIRAGVLLSLPSKDAERVYLHDDLEAHKQDDIVSDWRKAVNLPKPDDSAPPAESKSDSEPKVQSENSPPSQPQSDPLDLPPAQEAEQ